jgi:uncharacterized protein with HEPN domain
MKNAEIFIKDIVTAITAIEKFVAGMSFAQFLEDDKTSSAVIRKFEIIGEAVKNIPDDIRDKYSEIPWKEMAGMRDKLIHFYFGIDYNLVWQTIKNRLPAIKQELEKSWN